MKKVLYLITILIAFSCKDDKPTCVVKFAQDEVEQEYVYTHEGSKLVKVQIRKKGAVAFTLEYTYEYDGNDRLSVQVAKDVSSNNQIHTYYTYESTATHVQEYVISGSDTLGTDDYYVFYVENPADKIYHDKHADRCYKFSNGNLVQAGTYTVAGTDTTDAFAIAFSYDNLTNYYKKQDYRVILSNDYIAARMSSKNNLTKAADIGGAWSNSYEYQTDSDNKLIGYLSTTGDGALFEYDCK